MENYDVQIRRINPLMQGFSAKKRANWEMVKIHAEVLSAGPLKGKKIYLILWNEKIKAFESARLNVGDCFMVGGEYKVATWKASNGKDHSEEQIEVKKISRVDSAIEYNYVKAPTLLNEIKKFKLDHEDGPLHHIVASPHCGHILRAYLKRHPEVVNEVSKAGWHPLFSAIFKKDDEAFITLVSSTGIDLKVLSPGGFSLWDFIIEQDAKSKAKAFYKLQPENVVAWNYEENKKLLNQAFGKVLVKEKLVWPWGVDVNGLGNLTSLEELIKKFHPGIAKHGIKLVREKLALDEIFINHHLLLFLDVAYKAKIDINHLHTILSHFSDFKTLIWLADLEAILVKNEVTLEQFYLNLIDDKSFERPKHADQLMKDMFSMVKELLSKNVKLEDVVFPDKINNLKRLHDGISAFHRNFMRYGQNRVLNLESIHPELKELHGTTFGVEGQFKLLVPADSYTLCNWGFWMNNCVAGYVGHCMSGRSLVLGVEDKESKLIANIEIQNGHLVQLYGKGNSRLPDAQYKIIQEFLKEKGLLTPKSGKRKGQNHRANAIDLMLLLGD